MENGKNEGGKWEGMERAGWIHTHTPSSKSQKSAAGEGAGRPSGGGGWTDLGVASRGFRSVRLSCSRPAGAVPAHPPPGYGLPAQFLSLRSCSVVSTTDTANAAPLSKPKPVVDILRGEGSSKQTSCCLSIGTLIGIWLPQSQYHYDIIKYLFGCVNTVWTLLQCFFFFFLLSHDASLQDKNPTHTSLSFNPLFIRPLSHTNLQKVFPWCTITPIACRGVSQTLSPQVYGSATLHHTPWLQCCQICHH